MGKWSALCLLILGPWLVSPARRSTTSFSTSSLPWSPQEWFIISTWLKPPSNQRLGTYKQTGFRISCNAWCQFSSLQVFLQTEIKDFDQSQYKVEQVFYPSKDGTKIPMFIASSKDEPRDGSSPCLLYGYGGFNISLTPRYNLQWYFRNLTKIKRVFKVGGKGVQKKELIGLFKG